MAINRFYSLTDREGQQGDAMSLSNRQEVKAP